jgi:hypothetical protein
LKFGQLVLRGLPISQTIRRFPVACVLLTAYIHVDALAQMLVARCIVTRCKSLSVMVIKRSDDYRADFSAIGLCLTHVAALSNP